MFCFVFHCFESYKQFLACKCPIKFVKTKIIPYKYAFVVKTHVIQNQNGCPGVTGQEEPNFNFPVWKCREERRESVQERSASTFGEIKSYFLWVFMIFSFSLLSPFSPLHLPGTLMLSPPTPTHTHCFMGNIGPKEETCNQLFFGYLFLPHIPLNDCYPLLCSYIPFMWSPYL